MTATPEELLRLARKAKPDFAGHHWTVFAEPGDIDASVCCQVNDDGDEFCLVDITAARHAPEALHAALKVLAGEENVCAVNDTLILLDDVAALQAQNAALLAERDRLRAELERWHAGQKASKDADRYLRERDERVAEEDEP